MHMTERTLRRKLSEEGTRYREILDDVKCQLAIRYLQSSSLKQESIANLLGYSDSRNFRRAFKRWTRKSPAAYRKRSEAL